MKKIDIFCHILPEKYTAVYGKKNPAILDSVEVGSKGTSNLATRLRLMDRYPDVIQLLTIANPQLDKYVSPADAAELAKMGNDELAEIIDKYPDKFIGGVANVPLNNIDAALKEAERAVTKLGFKGIQMGTRVNGEPLSSPQFKPLYDLMAELELPIWIHPMTYDKLDQDSGVFSWPFESAMAMYHLVTMGIFNEHPNMKFIIHHCGAMVPYFAERINWIMSARFRRDSIVHDPIQHFHKFYVDTAVYGNLDALMCGYAFYGADHILFGTDAPLGPRGGLTGVTIDSVGKMAIPDAEKEKIFTTNAMNMLKLPQ